MAKLIPLKQARGGALHTERSYLFIDKRPVIDELRTLVEDGRWRYRELAARSGVTERTISRWFNGDTKRPQVPTVNAVAGVFGKRLGLVDIK